jgi:hypothetical protein
MAFNAKELRDLAGRWTTGGSLADAIDSHASGMGHTRFTTKQHLRAAAGHIRDGNKGAAINSLNKARDALGPMSTGPKSGPNHRERIAAYHMALAHIAASAPESNVERARREAAEQAGKSATRVAHSRGHGLSSTQAFQAAQAASGLEDIFRGTLRRR